MIGATNSVSHFRSSCGRALTRSDSESALTGGAVFCAEARTTAPEEGPSTEIGFAFGSETEANRFFNRSRPSVEISGRESICAVSSAELSPFSRMSRRTRLTLHRQPQREPRPTGLSRSAGEHFGMQSDFCARGIRFSTWDHGIVASHNLRLAVWTG